MSEIVYVIKITNLLCRYFLKFIFSNAQTDLSLMKAYMVAWKRFMFYYTYVPLPFAPLEKLVFNRGGPIGDNHPKSEETDNFLRLVSRF